MGKFRRTVVGHLTFGGVKSVTSEQVLVDLVVRNDEYQALYEEALDDALRHAELGRLPVVRLEYLAAMKMASGRQSDLADLEFLIKEQLVDLGEARSIVKHHLGPYAAREFDQTVMIAKWRKSQE